MQGDLCFSGRTDLPTVKYSLVGCENLFLVRYCSYIHLFLVFQHYLCHALDLQVGLARLKQVPVY